MWEWWQLINHHNGITLCRNMWNMLRWEIEAVHIDSLPSSLQLGESEHLAEPVTRYMACHIFSKHMWKSTGHQAFDQGQGYGIIVTLLFIHCYIHTVLSKITEVCWHSDSTPTPLFTHTHIRFSLWVSLLENSSFFWFKVDILAQASLKVSVLQETTSVGGLTALISRKAINAMVQSWANRKKTHTSIEREREREVEKQEGRLQLHWLPFPKCSNPVAVAELTYGAHYATAERMPTTHRQRKTG